tara:strand:- start:1981 stop:3273 length:1293 start_codon:yes stop_codon:yes gene_type:complete
METVKRVPKKKEEFLAFCKENEHEVYIFGADIAGKILNLLLRSFDLHIDGFIDNNKNKCGELLSNVPVVHAASLNEISKDSVFLITSTYISDIIRQLEDLGFYNWVPVDEIFEEYSPSELSDFLEGDLRNNHAGGEFTKDFDIFVLNNMINSQKQYLDTSKLYVRSIDLIITEKCTLKCTDCSNLMQYYENPINIETDELKDDIDDIVAIADEINEIRVIGGDAFANPNFREAIVYASSKECINKVVIYTNGVVCPAEEKIAAIAHPKVFVFITTYGDLSRRTDRLSEMLDKYKIPFNCQPAYGWTDCSDIKFQDRDPDNLHETFKMCCAKHFTTLTDGKVFRCPFSANVERLKAIPELPDDYYDIRGARFLSKKKLAGKKNSLRWYLREKPYIDACNYCNGRTYGDPEITPGIQTKTIKPYTQYSRLKV